MSQLVPPRFLFRWSFPVRRLERRSSSSGRLLDLPEHFRIPLLGELDAAPSFADVRLAWSPEGIGLSAAVTGRTRQPTCDSELPTNTDGMHIWVDTRNTQSVHRGTKFCQQFSLLPMGGGANKSDPFACAVPLARSREEVSLPDAALIELQAGISSDGYWLEAWLPKEVLFGYEPALHQSLGFHFVVRDSQFGEQSLAVNHDFPYATDPSLWQTLELVSEQ